MKIYPIAKIKKMKKPKRSCFQAMIIITSKMRAGKRCIRSAGTMAQPAYCPKTSSENKDKKRTKPRLRILGSQRMVFCLVIMIPLSVKN